MILHRRSSTAGVPIIFEKCALAKWNLLRLELMRYGHTVIGKEGLRSVLWSILESRMRSILIKSANETSRIIPT